MTSDNVVTKQLKCYKFDIICHNKERKTAVTETKYNITEVHHAPK